VRSYSKKSTHGRSHTDDMCEMPDMMGMQCMCPMTETQGMCPMMEMHGNNSMMNMQGMNPMMNKQNQKRQLPIPMLEKFAQISSTQIQIGYDRDVDMKLGMKPTNYWIQDTMNVRPKGIATLGKNDMVNSGNSLTSSLVMIQPKSGSSRTFILTFNKEITRGASYKLIICYVTVKGAPPYSGDNGMTTFIGK